MKKTALFLLCLFFSVLTASAHEEGEFSEAFVHPIELHHAHLENEFFLNSTFRRNVPEERVDEETGEARVVRREIFENSIEAAWVSENSRSGVEIEVPFSNSGRDQEGAVYGLGDIEVQPIQYSWIKARETVFTTSLGFILPTGDKKRGLGEGRTFVEPHFLLDRAVGSWHFAANAVPGCELGGEHEKTLGWGLMAAYSFRLEEPAWAMSLELAGESSLSGESEGADVIF